jgi:hypothetical protein
MSPGKLVYFRDNLGLVEITPLVERECRYSCIVDSQCAAELTFSLWRMVQVDRLLKYHGLTFFAENGPRLTFSCGIDGDLIKMNNPPPMAQMVT